MGEVAYEDDFSRIVFGLKRLFSEHLHEDAERYARGYASKSKDVLVRTEHLTPALQDTAKFMREIPFEMLLEEICRIDKEDGIAD